MASLVGLKFFSHARLKRFLPAKGFKNLHCCAKPDQKFTSVFLENRGHIEVFGEDSVKFLQGLLTNDVNLFHCDPLMNALYSMMLNTKGRVLYDFILYKNKQETPGFLIECDAQAVKNVLRTFGTYRLKSKVTFNDASDKFSSWAVINKGCLDGLERTEFGLDNIILVEDPRVSSLGARLVLPKNKRTIEYFSNVEEVKNQTAYDRHRVGLGVAEGLKDIKPGEPLPLEYNIAELHGVSFQKGCYVGQELTARTYHTGVIRKRLMPVKLTQTSTKEVFYLDKDTKVATTSGKLAGKIISVYNNLALGLMRLDIIKSEEELTVALSDKKATNVTVDWPTWWNLG